MSGAAFARLHGIRYTTFAHWRKIRRQQRQADENKPSAFFEEVEVRRPDPVAVGLNISLPGGATVTEKSQGSGVYYLLIEAGKDENGLKELNLLFSRPLAADLAFCRPEDYTGFMIFEWDESKSNACFDNRGFDFGYATQVFFDANRVVHKDTRFVYGEDRYQLMGLIEQRLFVVVYTPRGNIIRIISARKANQREVQYYENCKNED